MEAPDSGQQYNSLDEISPEDVNDWWREVMSVVPMRGYLSGGAVRCIPGSNDITIAPYKICLGEGGERVLEVETETTPSLTHAGTDRFYLYVSVTDGIPAYTSETAVPDAAKVFKSGDETKRYLATFVADGGDVVPFTSAGVPSEGMIGHLVGGTIRSDGANIYVAPFRLTMLSDISAGMIVINRGSEITAGAVGSSATTRYYCYVSEAGFEADSTTPPDDAKVFKSTDENSRYVGEYLTDGSGNPPAFNDRYPEAGWLRGGDIRSVADVIHVAPFEVSILNASTGVEEKCRTLAEMTHTPTPATNVFRYLYVSVSGGVPTISSSATGPDAALRFKTGDTTKRYLGFCGFDGTPHVQPFRKDGRVYTYLLDRGLGGSPLEVFRALKTGAVSSGNVLSLAAWVPPTSRVASLRASIVTGTIASGAATTQVDRAGTVRVLTDIDTAPLAVCASPNSVMIASAEVETNDSREVTWSLVSTISGSTPTTDIIVLGVVEGGDFNS